LLHIDDPLNSSVIHGEDGACKHSGSLHLAMPSAQCSQQPSQKSWLCSATGLLPCCSVDCSWRRYAGCAL
jgi:hypothetical protein